MAIRILIADCQDMFCDILIGLLESQKDMVVVGSTDKGEKLLSLISELQPDVLLLDPHLQRHNQLELLQELAKEHPQVRPILISDCMNPDESVKALLWGACGILRKDAPVPLLYKSIRRVMAREYWISREEVVELVQNLRSFREKAAPSADPGAQILSPRERQIVDAIKSGCTNRDIAKDLHVSERTVKYHLTRIFSKLGVSGRMELAHYSLTGNNSVAVNPQAQHLPQ